MIYVKPDGLVVISRSDFLYRGGVKDSIIDRLQRDGDIVSCIQPTAYKDIRDAMEIADWIREHLDKT